eukprot:4912307-Amphidinium_carterae.1
MVKKCFDYGDSKPVQQLENPNFIKLHDEVGRDNGVCVSVSRFVRTTLHTSHEADYGSLDVAQS